MFNVLFSHKMLRPSITDTQQIVVCRQPLGGEAEWLAHGFDASLADPPLAQPIGASLAKPDLNAPTSVSISASVIGVENVHAPVLMMLQPSL